MTNPNALTQTAKLIAIDWGSTGLRLFLLGEHGQLIATRVAPLGASALKGADAYAATLQQLAGDWIAASDNIPVLACGMVGSQHGWQEVPYVRCPALVAELAAGLVPVVASKKTGSTLQIVPGLLCQPGELPADLMRGEETQLVGAVQLHPELADAACIVLPGTHSKWAQINAGQITTFATHMTGELYAVLRQHSVLGRLMPELMPELAGDNDDAAFLAGVTAASQHTALGLSHQLFAVRSLGITAQLSAQGLADYLSGLLIGHELVAGLAWRSRAGLAQAPLILVGEPALCARYQLALTHLGSRANMELGNTATHGLWGLAQATSLV